MEKRKLRIAIVDRTRLYGYRPNGTASHNIKALAKALIDVGFDITIEQKAQRVAICLEDGSKHWARFDRGWVYGIERCSGKYSQGSGGPRLLLATVVDRMLYRKAHDSIQSID